MTTLTGLMAACHTDENSLRLKTRDRISLWEHWLQPVSAECPAGEDPAYHDDYQRIREEVNRLSGIDTGLICSLAESLLASVSKDLRIVTFYLWARLHQDGDTGLAEGLELLAGMLERFGAELHPRRDRTRKSAFDWLGSSRMLDSLSLYPEVDFSAAQRIAGALLLTEDASEKLGETSRPEFGRLYQALETRMAQSGGAEALVPQNSSASPRISGSAEGGSKLATVTSGRELMDQAKQLAGYLLEQPNGWLAAHHLMKSLRWDTLYELPPLDASSRTRLNPPKPDFRAHLKRLYLQQSWHELLELTDSLFSQGVNHLWLDLQWYASQALQKKEGNTVHADIIRQDLKALLVRLPELENLAFNDATPFADEVTQNWIAREVLDDPTGWQAEPVNAEASSGEDILALEQEVLTRIDSEGMDTALGWLQAMPGATSARDQWLMRLLMARVTEQFGKNDMALHLLSELDATAQRMTLQQWSPSLLFEVKARRLKLLRLKAARGESEKARLQPEMDDLLSGLITLDPSRASVLCG